MEATLHPTDLLRAEHQNVLAKLSDLERVIDILDQPDEAMSDLRELGDLIRTGIWTHIRKEEDVLFPEIKRYARRKESPIGQMLVEHQDFRKANERFQRGMSRYLADPSDGEASALIQESGGHIVKLLRGHFGEEARLLFPMADSYLGNGQEERILNLFETVEAHMAWCFENLEEFCP